jgi:N-acetylglutamate synthase-like GNAT family acetyltransferase
MDTSNWIEWIGYLASLIVFISLTMSSIIRLRIFNFIGCMIFAYYGYLTGLIPVTVANLSIALINVYYLYQIFTTKEEFRLVVAEENSAYFNHFLESNKPDIEIQAPIASLKNANTSFYMLRDDVIAGLLVGNKDEEGQFEVLLDYVSPSYRDYKLGDYYFNKYPQYLQNEGIKTIKAIGQDKSHSDYLEKIGFNNVGENNYRKTL